MMQDDIMDHDDSFPHGDDPGPDWMMEHPGDLPEHPASEAPGASMAYPLTDPTVEDTGMPQETYEDQGTPADGFGDPGHPEFYDDGTIHEVVLDQGTIHEVVSDDGTVHEIIFDDGMTHQVLYDDGTVNPENHPEETPVPIVDNLYPEDLAPGLDHLPPPDPTTDPWYGEHQRFDPDHPGAEIIGDPGSEMQDWHMQTSHDTCAVAAQEFVLQSLVGAPISEEALAADAYTHGWYIPGGGTPMDHVGDLIEEHGFQVEQQTGCTLKDLAEQLEAGNKVIVGVDGAEIWAPQGEMPLADYPGIPGQGADHAIEVIGIDVSDPDHPMVIVNDPGIPDGQGLMIPAGQFEQAWSASDNFMVHTTGESSGGMVNHGAAAGTTRAPLLGESDSEWHADWASWDFKQAAYYSSYGDTSNADSYSSAGSNEESNAAESD